MQKGQGVGGLGEKPYESDVADATICRLASCCDDKSVKTHIFREFSPRADTSQGEWLHGQMRDKNLLKMGAIFLLVVAVLPVVAVVAYAETAPSSGLLPGGQCTMWLSH